MQQNSNISINMHTNRGFVLDCAASVWTDYLVLVEKILGKIAFFFG